MKIERAMILCAGLGTRLLPITQDLPKPLVPILNLPNVIHSMDLLRRAGICDLILNLHHLAQPMEAYLGDGSRWGVRLAYSREKTLLGTGGGVKKAASFFSGEPFIVVNCDFVSNAQLEPLISRHFERRSLATMVLLEDSIRQSRYAKVGVDRQSRLCSLPKLQTELPSRSAIFTGIHILMPETLDLLKDEPSGINEVLYPHLMKNTPDRVFGDFLKEAYWYDTGDLPAFWSSSMSLLDVLSQGNAPLRSLIEKDGKLEEKAPGIWMSKDSQLPRGVSLTAPVLIGPNCQIAQGARVGPKVIVGEGTEIESGVEVRESVLLAKAKLNGESGMVEKQIVFNQSRLSGTF